MHYPKGDSRFEWRLAYFKIMVLPRLLSQRKNDFDIAIRCNPWHAKRIEALSDRIKTFSVKKGKENFIRPEDQERAKPFGGQYFIDFIEWEDVVGLEKYDIQTSIDSDDLILRDDYIDKIERECARFRQSLHLSFQPYIFELKTLRTFRCPYTYSPQRGSAFYSLYQPDKTDYKFIHHETHQFMGKFAARSITIPEGYCAFTVHDINESSRVPTGSRRLAI